MNFKTTYGLFAALLAILGVAAIMLLTGPKPGDENLLLQGVKVQKLAAKDFDTLTIERKGANAETLVFSRIGENRWKLTKPMETRVDSAAVERVVEELLSARREGKAGATKNLADVGLSSPSVVITLGRASGTPFTVSLGNVTLGGASAEVFAVASDRPNQSMPIRLSSFGGLLKVEGNAAATASEIAKGLADFRSRELLLEGTGLNPADVVNSLKLSDGKTSIVLAKKDGGWKFEEPKLGAADAKGETADSAEGAAPTGVEQLIRALAAIKPAGPGDMLDTITDLASVGLESDKQVGPKIELSRKGTKSDGDITETLLVGKKDDKSDNVFVRLVGDKTVFKIPAKQLDAVTKTLARPINLRDRQLLAFNPNDCDAVDIKQGDEKPLELRRMGEPPSWKIVETDVASQPAHLIVVRELLGGLSGKPVKDFPEPNATDATLGFDHPTAELTLWVKGIVPEEKKDEKPKDEPKDKAKPEEKPAAPPKPKMKEPNVKLIFGKRDKDLLYVRRVLKDKDGKEEKADFAVSAAMWPKVARGRIEFIDATMPSFAIGNVQRLAFNRGDVAYLIERPEKEPTWIIRQPANRADRMADPYKVEQILSDLSNLRIEKPWSEKPSERELERYGLKSPRLKATVTLRDGDKIAERVYSFGAETDDKTGYYGRCSDRDLVFIVRKDAVAALESAEVQDPVIIKLDSTKVTGIKLTGWKDVLGQPATRDLERKGPSNWTLKGDPAAKLSAGQCESFLKAIANLKAEEFVGHKSGARDESKLTVAAGALEIAISVDGEKEPVILTIGAVDPQTKHFLAMCNKIPGDVFLLNKGIFEAVKAKPGFFAAE